jgi:hypothetical protein
MKQIRIEPKYFRSLCIFSERWLTGEEFSIGVAIDIRIRALQSGWQAPSGPSGKQDNPKFHSFFELPHDRILHMKRICLLGVIVIVFLAAILFFTRPQFLVQPGKGLKREIPDSISKLPLKRERQSGSSTVAQLTQKCLINGFLCAAGWVHFNRSGQLRAFYLAESSVIQGHQIPQGTWIRLDEELKLKFLSFPNNTEIQGLVCKGGLGGPEGVSTSFYPSGRLKEFYTSGNITIQGISCRTDPFSSIHLYENGRVKQCTFSKDDVVAGRNISEGQRVSFKEDGEIESVESPSIWQQAQSWARKIF